MVFGALKATLKSITFWEASEHSDNKCQVSNQNTTVWNFVLLDYYVMQFNSAQYNNANMKLQENSGYLLQHKKVNNISLIRL